MTTCPAEARWGDLYSTSRDVTQTASWVSGDRGVVRVAGPGVLMPGVTGEAQVTVNYNGTSTVAVFRVYAAEPPWRVCPGCEYHIQVRDDTGQRLDGVLVDIVGGHMQGRSATSTSFGDAIFVGDTSTGRSPCARPSPDTVNGSGRRRSAVRAVTAVPAARRLAPS